MSWAFIIVMLVVIAVPGPDFLITLRSTIGGSRSRGVAAALGTGASSVIQGTLVSVGLGAFIVRSQPIFTTLRWIGVAYLVYLGARSAWTAWRGLYSEEDASSAQSGNWIRGFRQGFLSNITNPKILVFYLSLLPQFVSPSASLFSWLAHAWMLPLLGTGWLLVVVALSGALRKYLLRPIARRLTDAVASIAFLGFGARLVIDA